MGKTYLKNKWVTKDNKELPITKMETSHIKNTIKYLKRNPKFYDEEYGYGDLFDVEGNYYEYIDNSKLVKGKIEELEQELRIRKCIINK